MSEHEGDVSAVARDNALEELEALLVRLGLARVEACERANDFYAALEEAVVQRALERLNSMGVFRQGRRGVKAAAAMSGQQIPDIGVTEFP